MTPRQLDVLAVVGSATCWGAVVLAWRGGAIYYDSQDPGERTRVRWFGSSLGAGAVIVTAISVAVPRAVWRSLTFDTPWLRILGLVVLLAATALTIWARLALGAMWSAAPTVKEQHKLRTSGPYRITRHPIYTGLLGMMLGTLLLAGGGRWLVPFPVFVVLFEIKIHIEERLMAAEFPDDYPRYRRQVPQLVPGLHLAGRHRVA
jgi:protein-S-isoprenylcysteine O-methyltransferase Ste14